MKYLFRLVFLIAILSPIDSYSETINDIKIYGNKRITDKTIIDTIEFVKKKNYSIKDINIFQKKLFSTNFFSDIKINLNNNVLIINVLENPLINFFYLDGVTNKEREKFFYENLTLGQNKIFSEKNLKLDIEVIKKNYAQSGYFDIKVDTKISKLDGNVINLVLEIKRANKYKIKRVFFIGNKKFSGSDLSSVIMSSEHGWWKFLSSSSTINKDMIEFDKKLIKDYYLDNGYYDIQVFSSDIDLVDSDRANITYSINEGDKYVIKDYSIIDDDKTLSKENKAAILKKIEKIINKPYSKSKIVELYNNLNSYLNEVKIEFVNIGFNEIKNKSSKDNSISLEFKFFKSPRTFVNNIDVTGNSITNENVIRRKLEFAEGETLINYKLKKSVDNLKSSGIFKDVKYTVSNQSNELVDVKINVEEQPTGSISAGIGVGSAGSAVSSSVSEKNFLGEGINLNGNLTLGTEKISGIVGFTIPDFLNSGNDFTYNFYTLTTEYENAGYKSKVIGNSADTSYEIFEDIRFLRGAAIDVDQIDAKSSASALYKSREGDYVTLKGYYKVTSDKRDSKFRPTKGLKSSFGQSLAIPGSDVTYLENNANISYYQPVNKDFILNLKSGISTINSLTEKNIKLSDRKFLKNNQLRGFESYGVGPKDGKDHVGGNYSAYASVSTTLPSLLPEKFNSKGILFLDAGNVWGADYNSNIDSNKIRSSAGLALDWVSPLGPLSFVFAQEISSADGDKTESFSFNIGSAF